MLFVHIFNNIQDPTQAVGHEGIERIIQLLMEDTKGLNYQENIEELKAVLEMATAPKGSSWKSFLYFVEEVNSLRLIKK